MITALVGMRTSTDTAGGVAQLVRLLRLASPTLPVGAYCYSQGLEWAIESGAVRDAASARRWISDAMRYGFVRLEAPVWWRLYHCWQRSDLVQVAKWNSLFLCSRETSELREETLQMGRSLRDLLVRLNEAPAGGLGALAEIENPAYVTAAAFAAASWRIQAEAGLTAYCWSWTENQVLAALKAVPLGQFAGQRLLQALEPVIEAAVTEAAACEDDMLANFAPGFALASTLHETQYSRLFRS
jgi:urease accessory protein